MAVVCNTVNQCFHLECVCEFVLITQEEEEEEERKEISGSRDDTQTPTHANRFVRRL